MTVHINETLRRMQDNMDMEEQDLIETKTDLMGAEIQRLFETGFKPSDVYHILKSEAASGVAVMGLAEFKRYVNQQYKIYLQANNLEDAVPYTASATEHVRNYEKEVRSWKNMPLLKTGISTLDEAYGGGLLPGNLLVLTGGEGSMKTSLALKMVEDYLVTAQERVLFFSLDMEPERVALRRLLPLAGIGYKEMLWEMHRGSDVYTNALKKRQEIDQDLFRIVGGPMTLDKIKAIMLLENPSVVMIDYLTCIEGFRSELDIAREAIKKIRGWKREYGYTFVTLNQLSEQSKANQRSGHLNPPAMGGGSSQQAADVKIDLMKDTPVDENVPWKQYKKPRIIATISKTRDAVAGKSFDLSYHGPTLEFTGEATEVKKIKETKAIFEDITLPI